MNPRNLIDYAADHWPVAQAGRTEATPW